MIDTDIEGKPFAAALLGGDEHHAVGGAGTVQGGGGSVFQDRDRLDVIGVDVGDRSVKRNAVHHIKRGAVRVDGTETADTDAAGGTRLAGCGGELHAGGDTFKGVGGVGHRTDFQLLAVKGSGGSGKVFLVDRTVGDHHGLFDTLRIGSQQDVDYVAAFHGGFLVEVADGTEDQHGIAGDVDGIVTFRVRRGAGHGSFHLDGGKRNTLAGVGVFHFTFDRDVLRQGGPQC